MPTYEYRCKDCRHELEAQQAFTDDALTECPECAGNLKKVYGNVGISFKGSGFYKNDARTGKKSGSSSTSGSDGSSSKDSTKSSDTSSSTKSDSTKSDGAKSTPSSGSDSKSSSSSSSSSSD